MSTFFAYNNILVGNGNRVLGIPDDPYNPLHLRPLTARFKFSNLNYDPTVDYGGDYAPTHGYPTWQSWWGGDCYWTKVSDNPNVWDITINNTRWRGRFGSRVFSYLSPEPSSYPVYITPSGSYELLGANTTGVTDMYKLFEGGAYTYMPLFDTSAVTDMQYTFYNAGITALPEFDLSSVVDMSLTFYGARSLRTLPRLYLPNCTVFSPFQYCTSLQYIPEIVLPSTITTCEQAFSWCYNVNSGILDAYDYLSSLTINGYPQHGRNGHDGTFYACGRNSTTGSAELARIPADWKNGSD